MPKKPKLKSEIELVPFAAFKKAAARILSNTKRESDAQLAAFQASNLKRREARKKKP
jgi:hypothetical protein